jgi:hypothetical protein
MARHGGSRDADEADDLLARQLLGEAGRSITNGAVRLSDAGLAALYSHSGAGALVPRTIRASSPCSVTTGRGPFAVMAMVRSSAG